MLHAIALVFAMSLGLALAVDLLGSRARRRAMGRFGWLALVVAVWSGGELLLLAARGPGEVIAARRLLFLGPCLIPPLWLWAAWSAGGRPLGRARTAVVATTFVLEAAAYSFLWWDGSGRFMDWYALPPERGPVFAAHAVVAWSAAGLGLVSWLHFAARASSVGWLPRAAAASAALAPFVANVVYLGLDVPSFDPTPVVMATVGLVFRAVVLGGTFAPYFVSFAREELLDQIDAGLLVADVGGRVVEANAAARRLTGASSVEGESLDRLLSRARSRNGEGVAIREFPLHRRSAVAGRGAVLLDRSPDRPREQDLELSRRLSGLGFLAAGVAHEINNPLTYVMNDLASIESILAELGRGPDRDRPIRLHERALARDGLELAEESREGLRRISDTVAVLSSLGRRRHGGAARPMALAEAVAEAVEMARLGQAGRVQIVQSGDLPPVLAVRDNVVEIVLQLLTNALETDPGSVVTARLVAAGNGAAVEIADHGPGVPEAELPHVFDPFFTSKAPERRGVGLSFAHELARRHGGRLAVANRPEGGACFRLWLPAADDAGTRHRGRGAA